MNILGNLFNQPQQQQDYQNFANRYQQGQPWEGYTGQEVMQRYNQVAPNLPPDVYQQSAMDSLNRLSPQQRMELGEQLMQSARQQGVNLPMLQQDHNNNQFQDPRYLAQMMTNVHQQQPGLLGQLLGGITGGAMGGNQGNAQAGGSILSNPVAKAALAGITAMAVQRIAGHGLP